MGWFVSVGLALAVMVVAALIGKSLRRNSGREERTAGRVLTIAGPLVCLVWIGLHTGRNMIHQVPAGNMGVVYKFGAIRGQISEGLQTVAPWCSVKIQTIQVERHVFQNMEAFSQETQDVFVRATLNIRVSPDAIQELYRTIGPNYFQVLVESRVAQNFKDEIVKYKSVDIAPNREPIRQAVRGRLEGELSRYSIEVVDLLLDNVDFRPEFKSAIEAKQIATQRALEEEQKVLVERHRAEQAVERARGEGQALLEVATKQAEANALLSASLTPQLVQYSLIQKLGDKIQVMILPSGQNFILDANMLRQTQDQDEDNR
ncbi:MAG: hypothetical protein A3A16_01735 [Candidatus Harrisonbacteria bacterium RIFCSPLOWO2_01_FULL_44_18]|uniref:Band 7 domain-containing protein n=1 Tax=Candidatus Harrisonbacteria bacterium RIFCSPLOWO2_01_FULL_44_18 TaxID=1798407 RepID=A0A1G1ZLY0_9BACT|nr:MAG: hypothetical protein A3A16_01735 [Candidatus Harrisonbacteria bacterium RIFCSPLOWO2_01_FULL_44_18]